MNDKPHLLFLITEDWYFWSHRLSLARAARDAGFRVTIATRVSEHGPRIEAEGFGLVPLSMTRRGRNPLGELAAIAELTRLYRRLRPDIVHQVAMKPVLYGSIAAIAARVPVIVNALAGLGYVFTTDNAKTRLLRPLLRAGFRAVLGHRRAHLIVQNQDDHGLFTRSGLVPPGRISLIPGSGVDCRGQFTAQPEPEGPVVATVVARMLWDKGIGEMVEAARLLRQRGQDLRILLVGKPDPDNPRTIPEDTLRGWQAEGVVEWLGHRSDIAALWAQSHIAVLPSYREGLPRSLLEAAACARPLITTDVPGCRELVRHEVNGLLVPARDGVALADAVERLAKDAELRRGLGATARAMIETTYSDEVINGRIVGLYRKLLKA